MNTQVAEKFYRSLEDLRKMSFNKKRRSELSKSETSMLQLIKLCEQELGDVTTADLSERLHISKPATSQTLNGLEKKNLIQREINKNDRRLMCITLTEKGNQAIAKEMKQVLENVSIILDKMGKEDSELFVSLVDKYVSKVKEFRQERDL